MAKAQQKHDTIVKLPLWNNNRKAHMIIDHKVLKDMKKAIEKEIKILEERAVRLGKASRVPQQVNVPAKEAYTQTRRLFVWKD